MTEQELRGLVRDVIAGSALSHPPSPKASAGQALASAFAGGFGGTSPSHPSHRLLLLPTGSDTDGPCLIEPAVMCNHCGYCKSYGH